MAFLSEENQREIKTIFEQLDHDVHLEFFTERESPIIIPGGNCPTCKDTRLLLQEVVGLSDKLHLDVHEVTTTGEAARQQGIDRIPALIMSAEGVQGKIRYFGLPSGYEFSVLIGSLVDVSKVDADLADETNEVLSKLDKGIHIQVFVTPT